MTGRLRDKVAIVTGAASGIGRATARLFAAEGAKVIGSDVAAVDQAVWEAEIEHRAVFVQHDVREEEQWRAVLAAATDRFGRLDVLANIAGINGVRPDHTPAQEPEAVTLETWRWIQGVNVEGLVLGCRLAIAAMRAAGGGAIVNVSSIAANKGWPVRAVYGASKAAVLQYTKTIARHCAQQGWNIRCNAVLPGPIDTPMLRPPGRQLVGGDGRAGVDHVPLKRYAAPEEVARPILFLASDEASYVTGVGLLVDGGVSAKK
ncbi:MAG: SDR family oxidoreductase [Alphaproteobacteria bacterium]|nr:SDR family oxidoreductase [Alphaproteobacteria bacterium]